jgi:flotillin
MSRNNIKSQRDPRNVGDLPVDENTQRKNELTGALLMASAAALAGVGLWLTSRVVVSSPSQFVVKTGLGIQDLKIVKTALRLPFQQTLLMSVAPVTLHINVDSMSKGRIPFRLPLVLTVGPDPKNLDRYARLMVEKGQKGLEETISGIVQGEARMLTAALELDELYSDRDSFRRQVVSKCDEVIEPLGVSIFNANVAELSDLDTENRFFAEQKQKALQAVTQSVRIETAKSMSLGDVGEALQKSLARQGVIEHQTVATVYENERKRRIAESKKELDMANTVFERDVSVTRIEAEALARTREWELQRQVEAARTQQMTERYRANEFSKVSVEAEIAVRRAEAEAAATRLRADAHLYQQQQDAAGILAKREAEAAGLRRLVDSLPPGGLESYLFITGGVIEKVAEQQANAVQNLNPNINIWSTGDQKSSQNLIAGTMTDVVRSAMPLFGGIKDQTGIDFLGKLGLRTTTPAKPEGQENRGESTTKH